MTTHDLRPSQLRGVDFLSANAKAILADDTGLGKSAQAIRAADKVGAARVLILCQAIGRVSWAKELPIWQTINRQIVTFDKSTKFIPAGPVAVIAAFPTLSRVQDRERFRKMLYTTSAFGGFDLVIIDEAHHLSHPKSQRTKAVYGNTMDLSGGVIDLVEAPRVWLLTATLQRNNASELFGHMRALFPALLAKLFGYVPTYKDFVSRFCRETVTPYGKVIVGNDPEKIVELREAMRPFILRRVKRDVAGELGEVQHVTLPLEVDPRAVLDLARDQSLDIYLDWLGDEAPETAPPPNVAAQWRALGTLKIAPAVQWVDEFLEGNPDRKLIVFAHHRDVIEGLVKPLHHFNPVTIHGGVTADDRAHAVNEFQHHPLVRLFVGQTIAAGTSITLTAASDVLMLEPEWVPADNHQAISRAHRLGQTEPVTAWYAYAAGTVDERIAARARRKATDFDHLFGPLTTIT